MSKSNASTLVSSARPDSLELTVYQHGDAVVHEIRTVELSKGKNKIQIDGLPELFVEDSFEICQVSGPGKFTLGADCFTPADLNTQALLQRAVNGRVCFIEQTQQGPLRHSGKLLFVLGNQVVLETEDGVHVLPLTPKFELKELPRGLTATPSLTLEPSADAAGSYKLESMYETGGLSWSARYSVHYDEKAGKIRRLRCRVKLSNETGSSYEDAVFKLLAAGNSSRSNGGGYRPKGGMAMARAAVLESASFAAPQADAPTVESVGEQKIYILPEPLSLSRGQTKRPYLIIAEDVPAKSELYLPEGYYQPAGSDQEDERKLPVYLRLRLRNDKASQLGIPLPSGQLDVFQPDGSGKFQKTDPNLSLRAVAPDEAFKLELSTPSADVKAVRRLSEFSEDPVEEPETVNAVPEGGFDFPVKAQGGPDVGTPAGRGRLLEMAVEGGQKKPTKPKPRFRTESRQVTVFNFKDTPVQVLVHESLPGKSFEILHTSQEFVDRLADQQGTFKLEVPAKGKSVVTYGLKWQVN